LKAEAEHCSAFLLDTHCHLLEVVDWQPQWVVGGLAVVTHPDEFFLLQERSRLPSLWHYAIGLHPWAVDKSVDWIKFEETVRAHTELSIGEIGLDGYKPNWQLQKQRFDYQLKIASSYDRLISVHLVKDHAEGFSMIKQSGVHKVIIHGFCGSLSLAEQYQAQGWFLGIGARCMAHLADKQQLMLKGLNRHRFVLESDAPYTGQKTLTPDVVYGVALGLADVWQVSVTEVILQANENWQTLWKKS
jgi:TatD DNase family protein